jgi:uncharacterized RDD family membrane protein YckC
MSAHVDPVPQEARPYQGRRAGLITRAVAAAIDLGLVVIALGVVYLGICAFLFLLNPRNFTAPTPSLSLVTGIGYAVFILYLAVTWMGTGRTYGNHVMGLRVVQREGGPVRPFAAFLRAALYAILPIGLLWVLVSGQNRSLQDLLVRTSVIYDWDVRPLPSPSDPTQSQGPNAHGGAAISRTNSKSEGP